MLHKARECTVEASSILYNILDDTLNGISSGLLRVANTAVMLPQLTQLQF